MKQLIAAVACLLLAGSAFAQAAASETKPEKAKTPQQMKMKTCNAEAKEKGLKKADRKAFMKTCLKGDAQK